MLLYIFFIVEISLLLFFNFIFIWRKNVISLDVLRTRKTPTNNSYTLLLIYSRILQHAVLQASLQYIHTYMFDSLIESKSFHNQINYFFLYNQPPNKKHF